MNTQKSILLIISLLLVTHLSSAQAREQNPSISSMESKTEKIEKGRSLLLDAVIQKDENQILAITNYLLDLDDANYLALYPAEKWFVHYWLGEYGEILADVVLFDTTYISAVRTKVHPREDMLYEKLKLQLSENQSEIIDEINGSSLTPEDKNFAKLNFEYLISGYGYSEITQVDLNTNSNNFLEAYRQSVFEDYIRTHIRFQYKPADWGLAVEFFTGYGIFTEDLSESFKNNVPIGVAFDITYKDFVLYLRDYIGFSKTLDTLAFSSGTWKKDAQVRVFLPEASLGYTVYESSFLKIVPFLGIAGTDVSPTENDRNKFPEYEEVGLDFTTTYTYGLNLDLKFGTESPLITNGASDSYWFIRIRYAYNQPQFTTKFNAYAGNFHYITIGVGGLSRKLKRAY